MPFISRSLFVLAALLSLSSSVHAAELYAYATMPDKYASQVFEQFEKDTGIKVRYIRMSAGEALARLKSEKNNPQVDVILGGPADIHEVARKDGLLIPYRPAGADEIAQQFKSGANFWTGVGIMPLAFICNKKFLAKNALKAPASWKDLLDPKYKNGLILADPRTSGTASERLFSIYKAFGETQGLKFQQALHKNVQMYTKSGAWPALRVGEELAACAIVYLPDALDVLELGHPVEITYPKEGVTFGIEAVSLLAGAKHPKEAKAFLDWATGPNFANFILEHKIRYIPTRSDIKSDSPLLNIKGIRSLEASTEWKGEIRKKLTDQWINEVLK